MDSNRLPGLGLQAPMPNDNGGGQGHVSPAPVVGVTPPIPVPAQDHPVNSSADALEALDQEWVDKARDIVEQTKGDPFTQSMELNKVRAGYLKARYNKELKVREDSA
jgi:hypothetical protein